MICPTCNRDASDGYVNLAADEACMDPCHHRRSRRETIALAYGALCDEASRLGIPTSLDDPASPTTVIGLLEAVAKAQV